MAEYKQLSLRASGQFDKENNLKSKITGWGKVCKERAGKSYTRKSRVARNKAS